MTDDDSADGSRSYFADMNPEDAFRLGAQTSGIGTRTIASRSQLAQALGTDGQFGGDRDLYETLGYDDNLTVTDFKRKYIRQDIARRIVDAPAQKSWSEWPEISDDDDSEEETDFESAIRELSDDTNVLNALRDADRYAGIGYYGVLVMGFADNKPLEEPVEPSAFSEMGPADAIDYMTPLDEEAVTHITLEDDEMSEDFGDPIEFTVDFSKTMDIDNISASVSGFSETVDVHRDRILFIDPDRPRLEAVWNRLDDLSKVAGASAEQFWRGADYGLALSMDSDAAAQMSNEQRKAIRGETDDELEAWFHGLQPALQLAGYDIERLGGEDVDPSGIAELLLQLVAGTVEMPKRILTGSERGELASTQDRAAWLGRIADRQQNFVEPEILRPFIDMLREYGILPEPSADRYEVEWPDLFELSEVEQAEVSQQLAGAFNSLAKAMATAPDLGTPGELRQEILGWDPELGSETGEVVEDPDEDVPDPTDGRPGDAPGDPPQDDPAADEPDESDPEVADQFEEIASMKTDGGRNE